jgi:3-oxoacyl-[acyl-carrier-protein] synthase II
VRKPDYDRRVVVTGLGVISSVGNDVDTAWTNLVNGVSGLGPITRFDTTPYEAKLGGEVKDFVASDWMDAKAARRSESSLHFGVAAAKQALADSGLEITDENRTEVGVVFGSGAGGQTLMIDNFVSMKERGPRTVAPTFIANALVDSCSGMIAIETGAIGHNMCVVSACATGTHSVGEAAEAIRRGDCIAVISGSTEAPLLEVGHAGFSNMRGMGMPRPGEAPQTVSRPFDLTRDGFVLGEGAGGLLLEDLELAKARGARIYAEVVGYGSAADGWDMIQPIDAGVGSARAMEMALERRGVPADEVDLINPHGTSTPLGDKREAEAIWAVFGGRSAGAAREIAISATKSMTGHMMGAAGAFEAFATVKSVYEQCAPATINYRDADPECDLWVVRETQAHTIRYALSNNIGLGGHNGAVIFKRYDGD